MNKTNREHQVLSSRQNEANGAYDNPVNKNQAIKDAKLHVTGVSSQRNSSVGLNPINGLIGSNRGTTQTKGNIGDIYGTVMSSNPNQKGINNL